MPYLPNIHLSERWSERAISFDDSGARTFRALTDQICLHCCSPLALNCGLSNLHCSRVRESPDEPARLVIEARQCECLHCNGDPQRHRFDTIDTLVGADVDPAAPVVGNLVPVLQLRRLLLVERAYSEACDAPECLIAAVFCSFRATVGWVARNADSVRAWFANTARTLRDKCRLDWSDELLGADTHVIWTATLLRTALALHANWRLRTNLRYGYDTDKRTQWAALMLQLFADTHLDLHIMCDTFSERSDAFLETPLIARAAPLAEQAASSVHVGASSMSTPLQMAYPHPLRAVFVGELIDASRSVSECNLWCDVGSRAPSQVASFIHMFMCKATNHKCMVRDFHKMLCGEMGAHPAMVPFVLNLLECFHLGNLPGARHRPHWRYRKVVRSSYHAESLRLEPWCSSCNRSKRGKRICALCEYIRSIKMQVFIAVKEFLVFHVELESNCVIVLRAQGDWLGHERNVLRAADDLRRIASQAADARQPTPADFDRAKAALLSHAELLHDCDKPFNSRLSKTVSPTALLVERVASIAKGDVEPNWTTPQEPLDVLCASADAPGRMARAAGKLAHLDNRRWSDVYDARCVRAIALLMYRTDAIRPHLMAHVGMSPRGVSALLRLMYNLEMRDMPDNNVNPMLRAIRAASQVDFLILHAVLLEYAAASDVRFSSLGHQTLQKHCHALRLRHMTLPHQPLPPGAGSIHFCRGCGAVYGHVTTPPNSSTAKLKSELLRETVKRGGDGILLVSAPVARGVPGALYNARRNCLMCSRKTNSQKYRDLARSGALERDVRYEDASRAEGLRTIRSSLRVCNEAPLLELSLVGRVLHLRGKQYTLCVVCGCACHFTDENPGPTCGRHYRVTLEDTYTSLTQHEPLTNKTRVLDEQLRFPEGIVVPKPPVPLLGCDSTPVMHASCFFDPNEDSVISAVEFGRGSAMRNTTLRIEDTDFYRRRAEKQTGTEEHLAVRRRRTRLFINGHLRRNSTRRRPTVVVCAYCCTRATRNATFTRITVDNSDATLRAYLEPRTPLPAAAKAEVFLCKNCFAHSRRALSAANGVPPLTTDLWNAIRALRIRQQ